MIFPVLISPCKVPKEIAEIQSFNYSNPLTAMNYNEQEAILTKIVEEIENAMSEE